MELAPIILFVYNRPWHTEQTLTALEKNSLADQSVLYIYADGAKSQASQETLQKIQEVRQVIKQKWRFKETHLVEREQNWGLADNIVDGVTKIIHKHAKIIVLEDDIITSPGFLKFMNDALHMYENEEQVMHISGYMFPVKKKLPSTFFYNTASCWGWATWKRAWQHYQNDASQLLSYIEKNNQAKKFNIENTYDFLGHLQANALGEMKTWAVRWYASLFIKNGYALHPYPSLTNNIGHDGEGENCKVTTIYDWNTLDSDIVIKKIPIQESKMARKAMQDFNKHQLKNDISQNIIQILLKKVRSKLSPLIPETIKHYYRILKYPEYKETIKIQQEINRLRKLPRYQEGQTTILKYPIKYVDSASFVFIYDEIFIKEIYKFHSQKQSPYIIDAGANIGLSLIYFKQLYPDAQIVAFEPDQQVFDVLAYNVKTFNFNKTTLINKALWDEEAVLKFASEGADAGRIATDIDEGQVVSLSTTRLREYLDHPHQVDLLKIDIEGAEMKVLEDCKDLLKNVENLFVEYHSFSSQSQDLHRLLEIMNQAGFRYNIQHVGVFSPHPFVKVKQHLNMDLQLNIFAYRP